MQRGWSDPLADLERAPAKPYWLLYGEETFLVERALALVRGRMEASGAGRSRTLWADEDGQRIGDALADLRSPLLFGGREMLVVRHVEALSDDGQEQLLAALPTVERDGGLVLVGRSVDVRRRLFAACVRAGAAFAFPAIEDRDRRVARDWAVRLARERGHEMDARAAHDLVERSGTDLGQLSGELEKLSLHVGPKRRIEPGHVRAIVGPVRVHEVQELTECLARRDLTGATRTLRGLFAAGEPPIRVVAFLAANLRRALQVTELAEGGMRPDEIARTVNMGRWLVDRYLERGRSSDLARALGAMRRVDLALKSSRPAEAVFEEALLEIAG